VMALHLNGHRIIGRGLAAIQINGTAKGGKPGPVFAQST
jgi:hypothetical protein